MYPILNSSIKDILKEIPERYSCHDEEFPREGIERLKSLGLMALNVPLEFGGLGIRGMPPTLSYTSARTAISYRRP